MSSISRPYQIALAAAVVFGLVWALALRSHGSNPSEPAPARGSSTAAAGSSVSSGTAPAKSAATPTPIYHGAAPGVEGLTRAIAKAHGAVGLSQQNAQQLQRKSGEASNEVAATGHAPAATSTVPTTSATSTSSATSTTSTGTSARTTPAGAKGSTGSTGAKSTESAGASKRTAVERALAHGRTVLLLFWNPRSTVDAVVHREVGLLASRSRGSVAVYTARPDQVGLFRPITEVAYVFQTPTILIVNRHGVVSRVTGLTDVFALEQAVREARRAGHR